MHVSMVMAEAPKRAKPKSQVHFKPLLALSDAIQWAKTSQMAESLVSARGTFRVVWQSGAMSVICLNQKY